MKPARFTRIVCTIGPASWSPEILRQLVAAGMDIARVNFSHGTHEEHAKIITDVRAAAKAASREVLILQDLQGPKVRISSGTPKEGKKVAKGEKVSIGLSGDFGVDYVDFAASAKVGDTVLIDDGEIELRVISASAELIEAEVVVGGVVLPHKGVTIPGAPIALSCLTEKDIVDLQFGLGLGVDMVALSFVRSANDVALLRKEISKVGKGQSPKIVVKIERHEAIENISEIIGATDMVMVARGDLGLDVPFEKVPILQKDIIAACRRADKTCIVATQMLESMMHNPRPTRAEVSDVANAVLDHADAVMLSAESASGMYPVAAVVAMSRIIGEAEGSKYY